MLLLTVALFAAVIVPLAGKPLLAKRMTWAAGILAAVGGLLVYGYGYCELLREPLLVIMRTVVAVCCMFVAEIDSSILGEVSLFRRTWAEILFWVVQLLAFYATASAALTTFGAAAIRKLRVRMARRGELVLIYGANSNSLEYGNTLQERSDTMVVFLDDQPDLPDIDAITMNGCMFRADSHAMDADIRFLKSLGIRPGSRKVSLYALKNESADNIHYAKLFLSALRERGIFPEQTSLVIHAREDMNAGILQVGEGRYGYGFVTVFQEPALAARLLIRSYPPCDSLTFDEKGRAGEDFEALIVGFGRLGQAVLKSLVMNGQFVGSTFRAAVFSPDCQSVNGHFYNSLRQVLESYDVTFHPYDARSIQMFDFLRRRGKNIRIVPELLAAGKALMTE